MEIKVRGAGDKTHYELLREDRIARIEEYQARLENVSKKAAITQATRIGKNLKDTLQQRNRDDKNAARDLAANARRTKRANFIG
ncbi:hypothetical protein [Rickettsia endosymbiont of Gonocerus acuteangulatus]|uniref:hypothetical protein n=1 Tax=Rickettsia endosymbiont of Gonocerus acuteangulatus TaxID=3066266 RepID=UPI003132CCA2